MGIFMIVVLQRVSKALVRVSGKTVGKIEGGLVLLVGAMVGDDETDSAFLIDKISNFRIFNDEHGKMNKSIQEVGGSVLVVSQFTLCGDWRKGRRPSFIHAAKPEIGEKLYNDFINRFSARDIPTQSGEFGAMMEVELVNDGPVTFVLDSKANI